MKLYTKILLIIFLNSCTDKQKQHESSQVNLGHKNSKFDTFQINMENDLKLIRHDSVLFTNKRSNSKIILLSIMPARSKGFWILLSVEKETIFSNFKNSKTEISEKNYDRIQKLLLELKKQRNIDEKFCFECYADPTFFVLEEINNGESKRTINIVEDWQSVFSPK